MDTAINDYKENTDFDTLCKSNTCRFPPNCVVNPPSAAVLCEQSPAAETRANSQDSIALKNYGPIIAISDDIDREVRRVANALVPLQFQFLRQRAAWITKELHEAGLRDCEKKMKRYTKAKDDASKQLRIPKLAEAIYHERLAISAAVQLHRNASETIITTIKKLYPLTYGEIKGKIAPPAHARKRDRKKKAKAGSPPPTPPKVETDAE